MADGGRINFFTAEAEARATRKLGASVWSTAHVVRDGTLTLKVHVLQSGHPFRTLHIDVPNKIDPRDADKEYDAFIGKIACLL